MSAKRKRIPHVPGFGEVINASAEDSSLDPTPSSNAKKPVTFASLASELEDIKDQIAIMVEWLQTLDERTADED